MSTDAPLPDWIEDEFEICPRCGEKTLAPASPSLDDTNLRMCVACGPVPETT